MASLWLELIKHPLQTSILFPESKALTKMVVRMAGISQAKAVQESLSPEGRFVTYTYAHRTKSVGHFKLKQSLSSVFDKLDQSLLVWKNIPPAYVYRATKKRQA